MNIDLKLLGDALSEEEMDILKEYQKVTGNLNDVHLLLQDLNDKITGLKDPQADTKNLLEAVGELERGLGLLNGSFKSAVHKVLLEDGGQEL